MPKASSIRASAGISTDGIRHVTGRLDPAMKGKPMLAAVSTISRALAQSQDRCLSFQTGVVRPSAPKHVDRLFEEFVAGIKGLPFFVSRVVAMLADDQHAIDGQLVAARAERLGDRGIDRQLLESRGPFAAQVPLGELIDIQRHQVHRRTVVPRFPAKPFEESVQNHFGVRKLAELGDQRRDARPSRGLGGGRPRVVS